MTSQLLEGTPRLRGHPKPRGLAVHPTLYRQLYRLIADQITSGVLSPGDRLPPERDLCRRFEVGRTTVRRALKDLESDGLIESYVGRGTFVSAGPVRETNALVGLSELAHERGLGIASRVLRSETSAATTDEAEMFQVSPGSPIFHLERVRLLDGYEFALSYTRVPVTRAPDITAADFATASLYEALDRAGAAPARAEYTVWAAVADARLAELLALAVGDPVLMTSTRALDHERRLVETSLVAYRADRYRLQTVLTRRPRAGRHPHPRGTAFALAARTHEVVAR